MPSITDVSYTEIKDKSEEIQIDLKVLPETHEDTIYNILFKDELEEKEFGEK